jgi:hypothetical protein
MLKDDDIRLLMQSLGAQIMEAQRDPSGAVAILISETVKFRDQLRKNAGATLTAGDTRAALDALETHLSGRRPSDELTAEQAALLQLYIDRLTIFRRV